MALRNVNPTRAVLLNLKKDLRNAKRGHKLLKDKRDGLMKSFMQTIAEARALRSSVETRIGDAFFSFVRASAAMTRPALREALMTPSVSVRIDVASWVVMSVPVPVFSVAKEGNICSYGFLGTSGELDRAMVSFDGVFEDLLRLAEYEKRVERMALEIERTRRRVSALEHTLIPDLEETISFIAFRLEEQARDAVVIAMRVKAMIEASEAFGATTDIVVM